MLSGNEVCQILIHNGFNEVRLRGSHIVMQEIDDGGTTTVAVPQHGELRTGTLLSIIRQSGCLGASSSRARRLPSFASCVGP